MIIGFTGKAGAGKTTAADILIQEALSQGLAHKILRLRFADPVKRIAVEQFGWDGKKDARGRRLLQVLGTEAGRAYDPDIWVKALLREVDEHDDRPLVVIDDVRFDNEAQAVLDRAGQVICVVGRASDLGANGSHASESGIPPALVTAVLVNDGDLADLRAQVCDLLLPLGERAWN